MTNVIAFPGLGFQVTVNRIALSIGPFSIYWYGIIIAAGFLLAVWYGMYRAKQIGLKADDLLDILTFGVPAAIIGARAYYVIFNYDKLYYYDPAAIIRIWDGGLAIYGGLIAAVLVGVLYARRKGIRIGALLDLGAMGFLIGQSIGRWGNFVNAEAYGSATNSIIRMDLTNLDTLVSVYGVHPTFLYESVWNAIAFILLHFYFKKRRFNGEVFLLYVAWYGFGRGLIEGLRTDSLYLLDTGLRVSQVLGFLSCIVAVIILVYVSLFVEKENRIVGQVYYEPKWKQKKAAKLAAAEATVEAGAAAEESCACCDEETCACCDEETCACESSCDCEEASCDCEAGSCACEDESCDASEADPKDE